LYWHAALPTVKPGTRVLAEIVDENNARHPVATLGFVGSGRVLFHATDETHRWRFRSGDTYFGRYWLQTLRQLAKGTAAAGAELTTDNPDYAFGEPTTLRLRFRDVRQAPRDDRGVEIELARSGFAAERILLPRDAVGQGLFATQIRDLPPGEYHAHWPGPTPESSRDVRFVVHPPAAETDPQPQNVHELERLAHITGGAYRPQGEWQELLQRLPTATLRPIGNDRRTPLWNAAWVAALFVGLLSLEWWLRYRWGMY
jgi:hypothetical protein